MKLKKGNISGIFIFSVIIIFLSINISFAQESTKDVKKLDKKVTELATKLQQKLLLTDAQVTRVEEILTTYKTNPSEENLTKAKKDVSAMFDPRQKAKYAIVNAEWWNSVITKLASKK